MTTDEWLAELERVQGLRPADDEGMRAEEIADVLGRSIEWTRKRVIRPGIMAGRLRRGLRVMECIDGRRRPVPVYRHMGEGG